MIKGRGEYAMNQPKVSVIIPVYNTEKYLRECLDSAVNQTMEEIEIIGVDDCSTDSSAAILAEYAQKDPRVKPIYYSEHKSASQARKDGVMMARGQYIMFMDSDDALELNACEELATVMDKRGVDMLQFGTFVDAEPHVAESAVKFFNRFSTPYTRSLIGRDIFDACFVEHKFRFNLWNKIYKAELCKKGFAEVQDGYFPKAQDMYAFFFLAWYAESFCGIGKKYYHYKYGRGITGGGRSIGLDTLRRHCTQFDVAQQCRDFLIRENVWDIYKDSWEKMNRDLANECVSVWFRQLSDDEGPSGFDIMADKWGCDYILQCIQKTLGSRAAEAGLKMAGAKALVSAGICADPADAVAPDGFERVIPVVFATNEKYAPYAGVAIQSIIEHAGLGRYYRIYVLHSELSDDMVRLLEAQSSRNLSVRCLNVEMLVHLKNANLHVRAHISKETYYRFIIPEVLGIYPHVIYLDCDLVVLRDIADIIPNDMGTNLLAGVRNVCMSQAAKRLRDYFDLDSALYINAGVLVINLTRWKMEKIEEKCFLFIHDTSPQKLLWMDQDVLNIICRDRIYYLDEAWNYYWHMIYGKADYIVLCKPITDRIGENFYILHFASNLKPWTSPELALSRYFWQYARHSLFYEIILKQNLRDKAPVMDTNKAPAMDTKQPKVNPVSEKNAFVSVPSKLRGGVQCYRDHGAGYTLRRALYHAGLWEDEENPDYNKRPLLKRFSDCCSEHSAPYTAWRVLVKLHMAKDGEEPVLIQRWETKMPVQKEPAKTTAPAQKEPVKRDYAYYSSLPPEKYPEELKLWYKRVMKEDLDLDNPKTYNEKTQWMKLYDLTPLKTRLADKYLVRDWVKKKIGEEYLIPLLGVWDSFDEIDFDKLPDQFVLKANHGSGWNIIVKDKATFDKEDARKKFDVWMHTNFAFRAGLELHYMNIPPKIIAEKYIENAEGLKDFRFYCFNGKPLQVWVDIFSGTPEHLRSIFDMNWNLLNMKCTWPEGGDLLREKPKNFELMKKFAELLSKDFAFVRVDFFEVEGKLYMGEMTFTPMSGTGRFEPKSWDTILGDMLTLPPKSPIPMRLIYQDKRPED